MRWIKSHNDDDLIRGILQNQVELVMEDLHLFSNGIFSNVYKGLLKKPQRRLIAVKKSWSDQCELIFSGMEEFNALLK